MAIIVGIKDIQSFSWSKHRLQLKDRAVRVLGGEILLSIDDNIVFIKADQKLLIIFNIGNWDSRAKNLMYENFFKSKRVLAVFLVIELAWEYAVIFG
jgi:hypothetical protein